MTRGLSLLVLLGAILLAGCEGSAPAAPLSDVRVLVRTSLGEAVPGAPVAHGKQLIRANAQGEVILPLRLSGEPVVASCPPQYIGEPLEKTFPESLIRSGTRLTFELLCEPEHVDFAVAVLSPDCPADIFVDGLRLGTTTEGLLQEVLPAPERDFVEISALPRDPYCVLKERSAIVELDRRAPAAWILFAGATPTKKVVRGRQARAPLPYAL